MTARRVAAVAAVFGAAFAARAVPAAAAPTVVAPSPIGGARDDGAARFVLILGVNRSVDADLPVLHYADDDAVRYDDLFRALGGKTQMLARLDENTRRISPEAVPAAREPRRAELGRAVASLAADVAAARARGQRTLFYFVYAGHGNVDGKTAYLALEDARLDSRDIERDVIDKVHADESHLIIDACYSYFLAFGRGPEQANDSRPASMTFALPETGAASSSIPRSASSDRSSAEPSSEIDEHSTIRRVCDVFAASSPSGPAITSRTSSQVDTMTNTMSQAASSESVDAIFAPCLASGSALARVRFHTVRSAPCFASRAAIA